MVKEIVVGSAWPKLPVQRDKAAINIVRDIIQHAKIKQIEIDRFFVQEWT